MKKKRLSLMTTKQDFANVDLFVAPPPEVICEEELISPKQQELNRKIAQNVLNAHRLHVEDLMDILRMEMRVFSDFEKGLDHVTEDDITDYKELVGECLSQRIEVIEGLKTSFDTML